MRLSVLYRTHDGSNKKPRPEWYSRSVALASLRASLAASGVPVTFTFVVDGRMPAELTPLVLPEDAVSTITGGSAATSFRACVRLAETLAAVDPEDTVYWLAEDDYLYRPGALSSMVAAAAALASVDYFALYVPDDSVWHAAHLSQPYYPAPPLASGPLQLDGSTWDRTRATTSTFGVRRQALLQDAWLLRLGSTVGAPFDAATWVALEGREPFPWRHLARDLDGYWSSPRGILKTVAKPVMRVVLDLVARFGHRHPRQLVAPGEDLAMHLESAMVPPDSDWGVLAASLAPGG